MKYALPRQYINFEFAQHDSKLTKTALASVDEIAGYIAKDNPTRATSVVLELQAVVTKLQAHPGMGRAGRVPGTRELVPQTTSPFTACVTMMLKF